MDGRRKTDEPPARGDAERDATRIRPRGAALWEEGRGGRTTIAPGTVLNNTHQIVELIGCGGMGEVYRAHNIATGGENAVKIIRPEHVNDPKVAELFRREGETLRKVRNDAVVDYEGLFRDDQGRLYLVMEFVDGPSLADFLRKRPLTPAEVRLLRNRLAQGLAVAHAHGVFHRDISPDNIILPGGRLELAKIIDFGIAKFADAARGTILGGDFAGKYAFVSPEQLGLFGGTVDARSDIYSLGLVLAAAAIGRPLAMGESPTGVMEARRRVPDLHDVPEELRATLAAMLQPDPNKRPQTMQDLLSLEGPGRNGPPPGVATRGHGPARGSTGESVMNTDMMRQGRRRIAVRIALVLLAVAGMASAVFLVVNWIVGPPPVLVGPPELTMAPLTPPLVERPVGPPATATTPPPLVPDSGPVRAAIDQALAGFDCAGLAARLDPAGSQGFVVSVSGYVASEGDRRAVAARLVGIDRVAQVVQEIAIQPRPFCAALGVLRAGTTLDTAAGPLIEPDRPDRLYREGDTLIVRVTAQGPPGGYLYVDYLDIDGSAVHLLPTPVRPEHRIVPGREVVLGTRKGSARPGERYYEIRPPFGQSMLLAIASPQPLFPAPLPELQPADAYLAQLGTRLDRLAADDPAARPVASHEFITTAPAK